MIKSFYAPERNLRIMYSIDGHLFKEKVLSAQRNLDPDFIGKKWVKEVQDMLGRQVRVDFISSEIVPEKNMKVA